MKRREVIKSIGALAGAAGASTLLDACAKASNKAPGKIDTLIYLMMENRSYDHLLGARGLLEGKAGDGLTASMSNPDSTGKLIAPWQADLGTLCVPDPPHNWGASHAQFDTGRMDGFITQYQRGNQSGIGPMQYLARTDVPVTWALADAYATCDRWHASVMGPTFPNRYYWLAGTSIGEMVNALPTGGFTAPTIFGRMNAAKVDWAIYYADIVFASLMGNIDADISKSSRTTEQFFDDCRAGTLPSVSYLDPPFSNSDDHPPHHPILGQQFIASIYNALAASPQWDRILFVITYDEHGGFFDHVPPPTAPDDFASAGFDQLGMRVPAIFVGPYVKKGYVSSVVRNHASALKQIENTFGTERLSMRTDAAADLSEIIDTDRLARGEAFAPVAIPAVNVDQFTIDGSCAGLSFRRPDHDVLRIAHDQPELTARFDRRATLAETMRVIAERARGF